MKNRMRIFGIIALAAVIALFFGACGDAAPRYLSGNITITPNTGVEIGTELTASYSGIETVDFQWQRGRTNVGTNSNKYEVTEDGSYTVTVSAPGFVSKTSSAVVVAGSSGGGAAGGGGGAGAGEEAGGGGVGGGAGGGSPVYAIGDTGPAGGIIIYVSESGFTVHGYGSPGDNGYFAAYTAYYLEAAPTNQATNITWSSTNVFVTGATGGIGQTIGRGRAITAAIIAAHSSDTTSNNAAKAAVAYTGGGKSDWFLPNWGELQKMYEARSHLGISSGTFWSSWQPNNSSEHAFCFYFVDMQYPFDSPSKNSEFNVRAVRAF
jgi:hypothetical protein